MSSDIGQDPSPAHQDAGDGKPENTPEGLLQIATQTITIQSVEIGKGVSGVESHHCREIKQHSSADSDVTVTVDNLCQITSETPEIVTMEAEEGRDQEGITKAARDVEKGQFTAHAKKGLETEDGKMESGEASSLSEDQACLDPYREKPAGSAADVPQHDGQEDEELHNEAGRYRLCSLCDDVTAVGFCQECDQELCAGCVQRHARMTLVAHHSITMFAHLDHAQELGAGEACKGLLSSSHSPPRPPVGRPRSAGTLTIDVVDRCQKHPDEKLRFFCKSCQQPVCRDCILTSHKQHVTEDLSDATLAARRELSDMMSRLQQRQRLLQSCLDVFQQYKVSFEQQAESVQQIINNIRDEVKTAMESSHKELTQDLDSYKRSELDRIEKHESLLRNNMEDVSRLLGQQNAECDSFILMFSQHDLVSHALKTLDQNLKQLQLGQSEFFVVRNPKLGSTVKHLLGKLAFASHVSRPVAGSEFSLAANKTLIHTIQLRRELAFNVWDVDCSRSTVRSMVETSKGTVWVATSRSLLKVTKDTSVAKETCNVPDDVASIMAGPGDKLLVSFGQGSSVKLYSAGSWSSFASVPKGSTVIASRVIAQRLQVYVAITPHHGSTKLLSYSTDGQQCLQHRLPHELTQTHSERPPQPGRKGSGSRPASPQRRIGRKGSGPRSTSTATPPSPPPGLRLSCMALGNDGSLCLGDAGGSRLLMVDARGQLTGQYRGPDGQQGCQPSSLCVVRPGQVVVSDAGRSCVELVSVEGELLATVLSRDHFLDGSCPTAVTLDSSGRLWVGTSLGRVSVYSFINTHQ